MPGDGAQRGGGVIRRVDQWETVAAVAVHTARLTSLSSYAIADRLDRLARIGRTLHRLYEVACSEDTAESMWLPESGYIYRRRGKGWDIVCMSVKPAEVVYVGRESIDGAECHVWTYLPQTGARIAQAVQNARRGSDEGAAFTRRLSRLERRAADIGAELGVYVECERDPRGAALRLWTSSAAGTLLGCFR